MEPPKHFKFCPSCGQRRGEGLGSSPFRCAACDFLYYFNPTIAVAGFLLGPDGKALFIRRAKEPQKGKLAVPGGFVDIGETAEDALRRETREEVGLEIEDLRFLGTYPNEYNYGGVTYPVLDIFFTARAVHPESATPLDAVESLRWIDPAAVNLQEIAFPSIRNAVHLLRKTRAQSSNARSGP